MTDKKSARMRIDMALIVKIRKRLDNFELNTDIQTDEDILALSGASGAGKTMILKCIAGIATPDSGYISLNGRVLFDSEKKINLKASLRKTGYLFQDYALFPTMTARENINIVMKKKNHELVDKWLSAYGLEKVADNYPKKLSGGQKQRVAMIRMLASDPECILLDEPFSALDEHIKRKMEVELMEMLENFHKPIIFVSHNREEIYRFADKVCSVEDGIVSRIYDKKYFYYKPETKAQAKLAGCLNFSNISWIDESHVKAVDWGVTLKVKATKESDWEKYHSICIFQNDINIGKHSFTHQKKYIKNENINSETTGMYGDTLNTLKIKSISLSEELYNTCCLCELENGEVITMIKPKEYRLFSDDLQDKYIDLLNNVKKITVAKEYIHLLK